MTVTQKPVALAIDAGFGLMKFTRPDETGTPVPDCFRSIALDATEGDGLDGPGSSRDAMLVEYNDKQYVVGRDIRQAMVTHEFGRDMTDRYYESDVYHALMRGALAYMGVTHIDVLVLGLPLNHFKNARNSELEKQYTGTVRISKDRQVSIDKVIVHPQPLGGFLSLGKHLSGINAAAAKYPNAQLPKLSTPAALADLNVLVVDPGEYTLDWLIMTPTGPQTRVSNANSDAGRYRVIREALKLLSSKVGRPLGPSFAADVDEALRTGRKIRIGGVAYSLDGEDFKDVVTKAVADPVRKMLEELRGWDDRVDLVVVLGGEPRDVAAAIQHERPNLPLYCAPVDGEHASVYSNLLGFQDYAVAIAKKNAGK